MQTLLRPWRSLRSLAQRRRLKRSIDDELQFHIEQCMADLVAAGRTPAEARREAHRRFGNLQGVREDCRETSGASVGETLLQDLRYGARGLWRDRTFSSVAVLSLALGIGATTTVFSLVNAALWRPLPVVNAETLVTVHEPGTSGSRMHVISYPDYVDYRSHDEIFSDLLAWTEAPISYRLEGPAEASYGMLVSGNYFPTLGVKPVLGQLFGTEEDRTPGAHPVAVLGYRTWRSGIL